jgi:threonine dehydrogenase-like Zn-dependent dehydrogenase
MKALVYARKPVKYAAAMVAGSLRPGWGARVGPLELRDIDPPEPPESLSPTAADQWVRVRPRLGGICGSDLATLDGKASRFFEPIVSFPFVPGHEIVGELDDGTRVVVVPVLHCAVRGIDPPCANCRAGRVNLCERIAFGHLEPGLQCGYCESTGGGWSVEMIAHTSQLVPVPAEVSDEAAVMVEPLACAVHAARAVTTAADRLADGDSGALPGNDVAVIGSGTLGLLTIAALRDLDAGGHRRIVATAKHPEQRVWAKELGADVVCEPDELERHIRSTSGSLKLGNGQLTGGVGSVVDCVGSDESIAQAVRSCAPGGTVHLVGMPGVTTVDLTPVWQREVALRGAYAYTTGAQGQPDDFATALDLVQRHDVGRLVSATYSLDNYEDAIEHAATAGGRGAVKIAFDLRDEKERTR